MTKQKEMKAVIHFVNFKGTQSQSKARTRHKEAFLFAPEKDNFSSRSYCRLFFFSFCLSPRAVQTLTEAHKMALCVLNKEFHPWLPLITQH